MIQIMGSRTKGYDVSLVTYPSKAEIHVKMPPIGQPWQCEISLRGDYAFCWDITPEDVDDMVEFLKQVKRIMVDREPLTIVKE